jgi:hypothetical protein
MLEGPYGEALLRRVEALAKDVVSDVKDRLGGPDALRALFLEPSQARETLLFRLQELHEKQAKELEGLGIKQVAKCTAYVLVVEPEEGAEARYLRLDEAVSDEVALLRTLVQLLYPVNALPWLHYHAGTKRDDLELCLTLAIVQWTWTRALQLLARELGRPVGLPVLDSVAEWAAPDYAVDTIPDRWQSQIRRAAAVSVGLAEELRMDLIVCSEKVSSCIQDQHVGQARLLRPADSPIAATAAVLPYCYNAYTFAKDAGVLLLNMHPCVSCTPYQRGEFARLGVEILLRRLEASSVSARGAGAGADREGGAAPLASATSASGAAHGGHAAG